MSLFTRTCFAILACSTLSLPAIGAVLSDPPYAYGTVIMPVSEHFALIDRDNSHTLSADEYITVCKAMKDQSPGEALADFRAMDTDGDGALILKEFHGAMPSDLTV